MKRHPVRTAQAKPKQALLQKRAPEPTDGDRWKTWLAETEKLTDEIRSRLGHDLDVDDLLAQSRKDLEQRGE